MTGSVGLASVFDPMLASAAALAPVPLQADLARGVAVAMLAGFFAALAMDVPMRRQTEGMVPAYTAAAAVLSRSPDDVREEVARSAHYAAAILAGALFGLLATALDGTVPALAALPGASLGAYLVAGVALLAFLYGVFAYLVLPRFGAAEALERTPVVRRQWLVSAAVFVAALGLLVPAGRWLL